GVVKMQAATDIKPTRILERGPDYLRRQMELEGEAKGRLSAVERLAASRAKYVKSQQGISPQPDPAITPSGGGKDGKGRPGGEAQQTEAPSDGSPIVRRSSSKRLRPDSLLMYRHKCEPAKGPSNDSSKGGLVRRLFLNSIKDKPVAAAAAPVKDSHSAEPERTAPCAALPRRPGPGPGRLADTDAASASRKGVVRSHSDVSSRYSRNFSEFETFFKFCGLDRDVIESLGKDSFSAWSDELCRRIRSVSVAASEDGFTRDSGDSDGLSEEEIGEKVPGGTSVIERNARIIKWLYSCKNAKESGKALRELH
ncbi:F110C protein, partial [Amia calva]|nr:F110C protein [Amia calva]